MNRYYRMNASSSGSIDVGSEHVSKKRRLSLEKKFPKDEMIALLLSQTFIDDNNVHQPLVLAEEKKFLSTAYTSVVDQKTQEVFEYCKTKEEFVRNYLYQKYMAQKALRNIM